MCYICSYNEQTMNNKISNKHIVILAVPGSTILSVAGVLETFTKAIEKAIQSSENRNFSYITHVVSIDDNEKVKTSSSLSIISEGSFKSIDYEIDTLIVCGVSDLCHYNVSDEVLLWINEQTKSACRICSVCTGAFLLARAGILDGKKVTTHWQFCRKLAREYPKVKVEIAPYFLKDGSVYTSAGLSSGMDLALALVEEDMGKPFALQIAKEMVLFLKRPGNQLQYDTILADQKINNLSIRKICEWIQNNLSKDLSVENLAEYIAMSPRNFARVFVRELGITPAKYIDKLRIESTCQYLLETQYSLEKIAETCGVKNAENLRRLFLKILNISPSEYRKNFK